MIEVGDPADPRLADFIGLRDRPAAEVVIVEGKLAVDQLVTSPYRVRAVLVLASRTHEVAGIDAPIYVADRDVLNATVGFNLHRGVLASADRLASTSVAKLAESGATTLAVLERVNDHENLGGLFRNARAFGVGGVILDPETADPLYRRSIRVSLGHVLHVPFARADAWPAALDDLRTAGYTLVALTPAGDETLDDLPAGKAAFLLGSEGPGLSPAALAAADRRVRIPMDAAVDSLNIATAAALAFSSRVRGVR